RVSVTDKCNLRCVYCMPVEGLPWLSRAEILSYEEIEQIVREMAAMGLRRVRLTGGEPLVRRDVHTLAARIAAIDGIDDLSLSTNAVLLAEQAGALRDAGVRRLNVSLDSLRPERVDAIARRPGTHERIFAGLAEAERAGFDPIKVNVGVMRGRHDDETEDLARITQTRPWHARLVEVMAGADSSSHEYMRAVEMLARAQRTGALEPVQGPDGRGPATYFQFAGAPGTVGVITPMSHNYCDRCNRMRLTANGRLRPCLFGDLETNLRDPLRRGERLRPYIEHTLRIKPERHWLVQGSDTGSGGLRALSQVGG